MPPTQRYDTYQYWLNACLASNCSRLKRSFNMSVMRYSSLRCICMSRKRCLFWYRSTSARRTSFSCSSWWYKIASLRLRTRGTLGLWQSIFNDGPCVCSCPNWPGPNASCHDPCPCPCHCPLPLSIQVVSWSLPPTAVPVSVPPSLSLPLFHGTTNDHIDLGTTCFTRLTTTACKSCSESRSCCRHRT